MRAACSILTCSPLVCTLGDGSDVGAARPGPVTGSGAEGDNQSELQHPRFDDAADGAEHREQDDRCRRASPDDQAAAAGGSHDDVEGRGTDGDRDPRRRRTCSGCDAEVDEKHDKDGQGPPAPPREDRDREEHQDNRERPRGSKLRDRHGDEGSSEDDQPDDHIG